MKTIRSWWVLAGLAGGVAASARAQDFSVFVNAGYLYDAHSTTDVVPDGSLVLVVDTGTGSLGALTAGGSVETGQMLNSNSVVLGQLFTGTGFSDSGTVSNQINDIPYSSSVKPGDNLAIVWFPTLTAASTNLTANLSYGSFTDVGGADGAEWQVPPDTDTGLAILNFQTQALDGPAGYPESDGEANSVVLDAVPEPATYALLAGIAALGWALSRRWGGWPPTRLGRPVRL